MRAKSFVTVTGLVSISLLLSASCATSGGETVGSTSGGDFDIAQHPTVDVCPTETRPGYARCHSKMRTDVTGTKTPQGFGPSDLASAYNLPSGGGSGVTVAIVDAQDDPSAEADLGVYRSTYGLPPCTTANGCFKKVNQNGVEGGYPAASASWAGEISLDLDMVSAACPGCKIILVEANSATTGDLGTAVDTAASLGANAISNSYGGGENATVVSASSTYFDHPGILITASNGDSGYGVNFPAASQYVLAVGGTSLVKGGSSRGWAEQVWSNGGSGCSAYIPKPTWQKDTGCNHRTVGDVSAVADPNTGVSVYVTYGGAGGWNVFGGTSVASPLVAGIFARTGKTGSGPGFAYANKSAFYDVTSGRNGSCGGSYLCTGEVGYDGPSGLGTPNGGAVAGGTGGGSGGAGGTAGAGGSGGAGGAGGGGGSGGGGVDAGSGSGSGGGDEAGPKGYAFFEKHQDDRHHEVELASGGRQEIAFTWHDAAGLAPAADLWVDVLGRRVLQVSSVGGRPFARSGLDVVTLDPETLYRVSLVRSDDTVTVSIELSNGEVALRAQSTASSATPGSDAPLADVVLPGATWRRSIVSDTL
jgi:hypothetical protein